MEDKIIFKWFPFVLSCLFGIKSLVMATSWVDMVLFMSTLTMMFSNLYLDKNKKSKEIEDMVNKQNDVIKRMAEELDKVRTSVTSIKMTSGMVNMNTPQFKR